mgnify:CR=1 FL=1
MPGGAWNVGGASEGKRRGEEEPGGDPITRRAERETGIFERNGRCDVDIRTGNGFLNFINGYVTKA